MLYPLKKQNSHAVLFSFSLAVLSLFIISFVSYISLNRMEQSTASVEHTYQVIEEIQKVRSDIRNMDRSFRGYLLTRDATIFPASQNLKNLIQKDFDEIQKMTVDNAVQVTNLQVLKPLVDENLAAIDQGLRSASKGNFKTATQIIESSEKNKLMSQIESALSDMKIEEYELLQKRKWVENESTRNAVLFILGGGFLAAIFCAAAAYFLIREIRRRNQATQLLESSEERFRALSEAANDAFITVTENGQMVEVNTACESLFGYSAPEMVGQNIAIIFPKKFIEQHGDKAFEAFVRVTSPSHGMTSVELLAKRKDTSEFPVEVSLASWKTREGHFYTVFARDITERKFFTKMLLKNEHRLFQFLEAMPVGIFVTDHTGKPYYANQAAKTLLGKAVDTKTASDQLSQVYQIYLAETNQLYPSDQLPTLKALSGEKSMVDNMEIHRADKVIPVQVWGVPIVDETERVKYSVSVFIDITERKQNMKSLQESEEFFRTLFEESPIGMSLSFADGTPLNLNQSLCNMLGYKKSELMAIGTNEIAHPDDLQIDQSLSKKLFEKLIPKYQIEKRYYTKDKRMIWCKVSASLIRDMDDAPLFRLAMIENISEQKEAETALKNSEKRFRRIFEQSAIGMVFASFDNKIIDANDAYCRMIGYTKEELLTLSFLEITHPEDIHLTNPLLNPLPGGPTKFRFEKRYINKNKKVVWASLTSLIVQDSQGNPIHILTMAEDITQRHEAEEALKESQDQIRLLLDSAGEGIYGIDPEGLCTFCNPAALKMLGYENLSDILGKKIHDLVHFKRVDGSPYLLKDCPIYLSLRENKLSHVTDEIFIRADGSSFPVEYQSYPMRRADKVVGAVVTFMDITERKQVDDMKRDLISVVSHQLKTPVAEINGYVENLLEGLAGNLSQKQREYLVDMREIGMENYRLISDLLSMSKIERGIISVDLQPVKLKQVVELAIRDYASTIQRKGLDLIVDFPPEEIVVLADQDKTVETLRNIINNALKCTDKGSITIRTETENAFGLVKVSDTGIGMSENVLKRLFTKDRVLGSEASRSGAGLGLYIAKSFMQLQNGDISVISQPGKGSTFYLKIPKIEQESNL